MTVPTAAHRLGRWVSELRYDDIPPHIAAVGVSCLIDTFGVALAGARTEVSSRVGAFVDATYATGHAHVLGTRTLIAPGGAAFANGTAAHALDFDDNCYAGIVHGSAVVAPAALATCEHAGTSGSEFLTAFVAGVEAEYAIGKAFTRSLYDKGWFNSALLGAIGAAAASARALGLDENATTRAIGFAVAGTGGTKAAFGTNAKPVLTGRAAEMGVTAALLAAKGITAPDGAFEDARGFARLFNEGVFHHGALDALGSEWSLETPGIDVKRIPICLSAHAAVDNLIDMLEKHKLAPADIEAITCDVPQIVANNLAYRVPRQVQEAQFSLPYAIACVLVFGDIGLEHLDARTLNDPRLADAMSKVTMHVSERWNSSELQQDCPEGAYVGVTMRDGRKIESFTCSARGTVARPLSDADLAKKFMSCVRPVSSDEKAAQLLSRLRAVADMKNIRDLFGA